MTHPTDKNIPWFVGTAGMDAYVNPQQYVVLDFETTNLDKGSALEPDNHIVLACWYVVTPGHVEKKYKFADEYDLYELEQDINASDFVVAHNAKFELQWMKRMGMDLRKAFVFDTYLAEWVLGGNRWRFADLSLEQCAQRRGIGHKVHMVSTMIGGGVCPSTIPKRWLLDYCFQDVELSYKLYLLQLAELREQGLLHLFLVRCLTAPALADIETAACELDTDRVAEEYTKAVNEYRQLEKELHGISGGAKLRGKQLPVLLYETLGFSPPIDPKTKQPYMTATGRLSTDKNTLAKLTPSTDVQRRFLEILSRMNRLDALLTKNLEFFEQVCKERDGKFMGVINQGSTQTHRLSSSGRPLKLADWKTPRGPQLQNLPRALKRIFTSHDPDYFVGEADGAQLEFRVAAEMGSDQVAIEEIATGADIHSTTAKVLYEAGEPSIVNVPPDERRQAAKADTFAPLYGSSGRSPATKKYTEFFRNKYRGIFTTQTDWTFEVANTDKLRTPYGMVFYWPNTRMSKSGYVDNTTSIFNYPIQGFATAEIIPIALVHFWHRAKDIDVVLWNTVHDSLVSRVHKDCVEEYEEISKIALTYDVYDFLDKVYDYKFSAPLGVGIKVARHWGDTKHEKTWSVWPDGREQFKEK
jgi:DNA polymerase I-like protein with 3'-5' exonuclease and polymerase domains